MRRFLLPLALVTVAFAGCLEDDGPPPAEGPGADEPRVLEPRELDRGQHSGVEVATQELIADEERWLQLWEQHVRGREPAPEVPVIDFESERVVAVVLGERPNGCWHVELGTLTEDAAGIEAEIVIHRPGEDAVCPDVIVQPFHFVAVESRALHVSFEDSERVVGPDTDGPPASPSGDVLEMRTLAQGQHSGLGEERRESFGDEASWHAFWSEHAQRESPPPAAPEVDFASERVVAVALPVKPSGGYGVAIERVVWTDGTLTVEYLWHAPPEGHAVTAVETQPFHFVAVPLTMEPDQVVFLEGRAEDR